MNYSEMEERSPQCSEQALECLHENKVDDIATGTCVCWDCALVLEEQIYMPSAQQSEFSAPFNSKCYTPKEKSEQEVMREVCEKLNIPAHLLLSAELYKENITPQLYLDERKKRFTSLEVYIYALNEILIREGIPRCPRELTYIAGLQENVLWYISRRLVKTEDTSPETAANDLVERYRTLLALTFQEGIKIKRILQKLYDIGMESYRPNTVIAVAIHLYSKQFNLQLKLKEICNVCGVSIANVYRITSTKSVEWKKDILEL
jgi:transcription initiation factor TFIIIB Brf1 subunit/transcription initiation factor TFIIB